MNSSSSRRILNFPVVQSSLDVSPAALVNALVALSNNIVSIPPNSFTIHRQNVRRIVRHVGLLVHYLQEIHESPEYLRANSVVSLSELHVTLQRAQSLVQDCATPGARLWILALSDRVLDEFRQLNRSLSTVIDVLMLADINVSDDTKDLLLFLGEQSGKGVVEMEPLDASIARLLWSVLDQFKNGVFPAKRELRRIVQHLGVKSWVECSEEISFLEEVIEGENRDDRVLSLASSLIGFLVYCRVVLFDCVERSDEMTKLFRFGSSRAIDGIKEDDLRCPISLELMMDPVTVATGQTYDRSSITKWFESGKLICPVTGWKLDEAAFVPNLNMSSIVQDYCSKNKLSFDVPKSVRKQEKSKEELPFSSVNASASRMTAEFLVGRFKYGSNQEKNKAAFEIRNLSGSNIFTVACVEAGAVPWLLNLFSYFDYSVRDNAVAATLNLSRSESGQMAILEAGGFSLIADTIISGTTADARQNAAEILLRISFVAKHRKKIGDEPNTIPALVQLLSEGTYRAKKIAVATLYALLLHPDNLEKTLKVGVVPELTKLLLSEKDDLANDSLMILAKIAERQDGASTITSSAALPELANVLVSTASRSVKESCICLLLSLCNTGSEEVLRLLERMPMFVPSLYALMAGGSPQAMKKAKLLLKYIRLLDKPDYPSFVALIIPDNLVRAQ